MSVIDRLGVKTKLAIGAGLVLVVSATITLGGIRGLRDVRAEVAAMQEDGLAPVKSILSLKADLMEARALLVTLMNEKAEPKQKDLIGKIEAASKRIDDGVAETRGMAAGKRESA